MAGLASEPETGQAFRDSLSRLVRPDERVFSGENLARWFAAASDRAHPVPA